MVYKGCLSQHHHRLNLPNIPTVNKINAPPINIPINNGRYDKKVDKVFDKTVGNPSSILMVL